MDIGFILNILFLFGYGIEIWIFFLNLLIWVIIKIDVIKRVLMRKKRKYMLFLSDSISLWIFFCFLKFFLFGDKYFFINLCYFFVLLKFNLYF